MLHFGVGEGGFVRKLIHQLGSRNRNFTLMTTERGDLHFVTFTDDGVVTVDRVMRMARLLHRTIALVRGTLLT